MFLRSERLCPRPPVEGRSCPRCGEPVLLEREVGLLESGEVGRRSCSGEASSVFPYTDFLLLRCLSIRLTSRGRDGTGESEFGSRAGRPGKWVDTRCTEHVREAVGEV